MLIDTMAASVVIIALDGRILYVNEAWRDASRTNGGDRTSYYVGQNYLRICRDSSGGGPNVASLVEGGLTRVLHGAAEFSAEYPCHSPSKKRWFEVVARPFEIEGVRHALVTHRSVTASRLQEIEAQSAGNSGYQ